VNHFDFITDQLDAFVTDELITESQPYSAMMAEAQDFADECAALEYERRYGTDVCAACGIVVPASLSGTKPLCPHCTPEAYVEAL
jgi:hypothetical protein